MKMRDIEITTDMEKESLQPYTRSGQTNLEDDTTEYDGTRMITGACCALGKVVKLILS